jgi:hypothetical protein
MLDVDSARENEDAAIGTHHLDGYSIEPRQNGPGNHLLYRAQGSVPLAEIQHPVETPEQRIELVRAEQHRQAQFLLQPAHQLHNASLMAHIEANQRLIQQQQARLAKQGLREQQPLSFAAGDFAERTPGQIARIDQIERLVHLLPPRNPKPRQSPAMAMPRAGDEVPAAQSDVARPDSLLRHIPDSRVAAPDRHAQHADCAPARRNETEQGPQQGRLPRAVRAEHAHELAAVNRKRDVREHRTLAIGEGHALKFDRVQPPARARARSSAWS